MIFNLVLCADSDSLDFKELDVGVVPDRWVRVTQVDHAPHVSPEMKINGCQQWKLGQ